jgi:hypothetical protein
MHSHRLSRVCPNQLITMAPNTTPTKATSAQKYPCSMCNKKSFKSKEALGDHQIARHAHSCTKCEERFNSAESLAQHMKDKDHNTKKAKVNESSNDVH